MIFKHKLSSTTEHLRLTFLPVKEKKKKKERQKDIKETETVLGFNKSAFLPVSLGHEALALSDAKVCLGTPSSHFCAWTPTGSTGCAGSVDPTARDHSKTATGTQTF